MKIRFLNKTIENQKFRYTPLYYNERNERLKRKKQQFQESDTEDISEFQRKERLRDISIKQLNVFVNVEWENVTNTNRELKRRNELSKTRKRRKAKPRN